ncbi:MAG: hypothetical protein ACRD3O_20840, partial [Terriglobia bacterium]
FNVNIGPDGTGYYIVAPIGPSGMALFGDKGKFVSMGKERIAWLEQGPHSLTAQVLFANNENSVTLFGYSPSKPAVVVRGGRAGSVMFTKVSGYFSVQVSPQLSAPPVTFEGDLVRRVTVAFRRP